MTDYNFDVDVLRGRMASALAANDEQFIFVLTNAIANVSLDDAIEFGELGDEADADIVVIALREIADAIEDGKIT